MPHRTVATDFYRTTSVILCVAWFNVVKKLFMTSQPGCNTIIALADLVQIQSTKCVSHYRYVRVTLDYTLYFLFCNASRLYYKNDAMQPPSTHSGLIKYIKHFLKYVDKKKR